MALTGAADDQPRRRLRALLLTASLLAGVTILAGRSSWMAQADRIAPPGWAITLTLDDDMEWDAGFDGDRAYAVDLRIMRNGTSVAVVAVRHHHVTADATSLSIAQDVFSRRILGVGTVRDVPGYVDRVGPYPAVALHYINDHGKTTMVVCAFIADVGDAYSFTLRVMNEADAGYAYRRFQRLTGAVRPVTTIRPAE